MTKEYPTEIFASLDEVKCPVCGGQLNAKWFNFATNDVADFIAECWSPENPDSPRHIFEFQIEIPECVLVSDVDSKVFE